MSHTLSVLSHAPDTTRRPSGETATHQTYDEDTSSQKYSGRRAPHVTRVPFQPRHEFPSHHVPDNERVVGRRRHDAPPVRGDGDAIDLRRSQIITKVLQIADAATRSGRPTRVPFQRRHAFAGLDVPHLERLVVRPRHDAPPVRGDGNARDLRRRHIITKVQRTPQRTQIECPSSVSRHSPVATSHTLSFVSNPPAETTRRPSGNTATP